MSNSLQLESWTIAHQAALSMGFSRQEYWSGLPFPTPQDLPTPGILIFARFWTELQRYSSEIHWTDNYCQNYISNAALLSNILGSGSSRTFYHYWKVIMFYILNHHSLLQETPVKNKAPPTTTTTKPLFPPSLFLHICSIMHETWTVNYAQVSWDFKEE